MRAVIEIADGLFLIKFYGSDGLVDTYVVNQIQISYDGGNNDEDIRFALEASRKGWEG